MPKQQKILENSFLNRLSFSQEIEKLFISFVIPRKIISAIFALYLIMTMSIVGYIGTYILTQLFSSFK
jgi:hypothetical protein